MKVTGQPSVVRGMKDLVNPSTLFRDEEKLKKTNKQNQTTTVVLKITKQKLTGWQQHKKNYRYLQMTCASKICLRKTQEVAQSFPD